MLGRDVDVAVAAKEAGEVPILVLALPFAAPQLAAELLGKVIFQPLGTVGDAFNQVRRDARLLLQLAKRREPGIVLALVDAALRHLPRFVSVIDTGADEHLASMVEQHDADSAAVTVTHRARSTQ